jgi:hypothetical protein
VIIPAYSETDIFSTLNSISATQAIESEIEVLILVNYPEGCSIELKQQNNELYNKLKVWAGKSCSHIRYLPLLAKNLPDKHAGAGLARKILMDTACSRFNLLDRPDGFILSIDADTLVPENYFSEINKCVNQNADTDCLIFNFAHPLYDTSYTSGVYRAVAQYEMHLRYYKQILQAIGYPFYHYTIGSCFGVKAKTYVKVGGMSKRKAGEDFYFLQKVFPNAITQFVRNIKLIPSPRPSWRVPFGTGPAIRKIMNDLSGSYASYHPQSFYELQNLFEIIPLFYVSDLDTCNKKIAELPDSISNYLINNNIQAKITEIKNNSASELNFIKRFYHWFDAFNVLKYLNYSRINSSGTIDVIEATRLFLKTDKNDVFELLEELRKRDD